LHTNNAIGIIPRLLDMGIEPYLLPSALSLMEAQRLVGRLCDACKKAEPATAEMSAVVEQELAALPKSAQSLIPQKKPFSVYRAEGCDACNHKGVVGRVGMFEIFSATPEIRALIHKHADTEAFLAETKRQGMITMRQDGIIKALNGIVSMEEVLRETKEE
ncbi:MAG: hypothetical protein HYS43_01705, partial [Candidatus Liptonbacteria bacterium]|nr:hypothetical protein [Candidatus Liptonbacteria bacterium]